MSAEAQIYAAWRDANRDTGGNSVVAFGALLRENPTRRAQLFRLAAQERAQGSVRA